MRTGFQEGFSIAPLTKIRFYNTQKLLNLGVSEHHVRTAGTVVSSGILVS